MQKKRKPLHFIYQVMRFTAFQLFLLVLTFATLSAKDSNAQEILNQKVSVNLENVKLKKAISTLEKAASVYFTYNPQKIKSDQRVTAIAADASLESVLDQLFSPINVNYKVYSNSHIVLTRGEQKVTANDFRLITGKVTDDTGTVLGSRGKPRTNVDRPVPIDVIGAEALQSTSQVDIGQSLTYSAPSFNAPKFGINDLAPLIDPASLRGLSPDQTLLLVNGKRRHKVAFFSNNSGVGKGQVGNDINSIPSAAVKQVENS